MTIDERLKDYATPAQARYIDAVNEAGSKRAAARLLGVHRRMIDKGLAAVELKASRAGYAPSHGLDYPAPPGRFVPKTTVHFKNGQKVEEWVRFAIDDEQFIGSVKDAITAFCEEAPKIEPIGTVPSALQCNSDVIPWINIGDAHFGMIAHASEVGFDFNLQIAEAEMKAGIGQVIDELPYYDRLVIQDMGDFTHYENTSKVTERSRHSLDVDGTMPQLIEVYTRTMRWIIEKALTKAKVVDVIINQANHSRSNDWWMAQLLRAVYGESGRVNVIDNSSPFIAYRMGNVLVLCHHSDLVKPKGLADIMTCDFRKDYGETLFHYVDIGHVHHEMVVKQHPSVRVESFNQLARPDKYAFEGGWRNRNSLTVVFRSKTFGEIGRRVLPIEELQTRLYGKPLEAQRTIHRVA
ncbi:hypothetical protein [Sphingomonas jaspsi]|uniref:hypothetical protein n=1 Tax=Sphingomonas jaspsi TaxID=392409 RepID=UPI0004B33361|nr:hypothetical protein [Sphingomonas jaspsi]